MSEIHGVHSYRETMWRLRAGAEPDRIAPGKTGLHVAVSVVPGPAAVETRPAGSQAAWAPVAAPFTVTEPAVVEVRSAGPGDAVLTLVWGPPEVLKEIDAYAGYRGTTI